MEAKVNKCLEQKNVAERIDLKHFKESIVTYGIHSPYVRQMSNTRSTQSWIMPQDGKDLAAAVLEAVSQLQ